EVARRVAKAVLLLVRRVVLLVDHDQSRPHERREDRGARSDDDAGLPRSRAAPRREALAFGEPGMKHREGFAEALTEALHELRRQADLGHEQQRLAAGIELL